MPENTAVYEGMFILDSNRLARDREGLPRELGELIESVGGHIELSRLWEERRLAFPIKGHRKGSYWITYFRAPTTCITDLGRQCELNEGILRQLFIRLPDSLVDPILDHAKGNSAQTVPEVAEEPEEETEAVEAVEASAS